MSNNAGVTRTIFIVQERVFGFNQSRNVRKSIVMKIWVFLRLLTEFL